MSPRRKKQELESELLPFSGQHGVTILDGPAKASTFHRSVEFCQDSECVRCQNINWTSRLPHGKGDRK